MTDTSAHKVADHIIRMCHDSGDLITNLKLQKLLYYAQAWRLALRDRPLFDDKLEAWVHGPAVPSVYGRFKNFRWDPISLEPDDPHLSREIAAHLDEVMAVYGIETAYALEMMTHREAPWLEARGDLPPDQPSHAVISHESMKRFYREMASRAEDNKRTSQSGRTNN